MGKKLLLPLFALILLISIAASVFFYMKYQQSQSYLKDPNLASKEETASVVAKIGALMELPKNEEPTLATVQDISKLKGQEFFAKAKNGDKMLIYSVKKEIILYRPSTNKIINIAPISFNNTEQPTVSATPSASVTKASPTNTPVITPTIVPSPIDTVTP